LGAETILKELKNEKPVTNLRVGILIEGSPARGMFSQYLEAHEAVSF
jgi:hypothetical protein